ncbi:MULTISPECIES: hypothetical protein [Enterobacterales]|uniref:hypothetical protein n=1 Tax=Enterobacterales TaxID=91347 RepID=UPI002ED7E49B
MSKYQLRRIDPMTRCENKYIDCVDFDSFSDLRDEMNTRRDPWIAAGFDVLNADGEIIFSKDDAYHCRLYFGSKYTLKQIIEYRSL